MTSPPARRKRSKCNSASPGLTVRDVNGRWIETFDIGDEWFWRPARLVPRCEPQGPFPSEAAAIENAMIAQECR